MNTKFFVYRQNSSGGVWVGPLYLVVEAVDAKHANAIAEKHIYFDGCQDGRDCSCCGDRWSRQWDGEDGQDTPDVTTWDWSEADGKFVERTLAPGAHYEYLGYKGPVSQVVYLDKEKNDAG